MAPKNSTTPPVKLVQDPDEPMPTEVLAGHIRDLSASAKRLLNSGLNRRALLILLRDSSGVPMSSIDAVLDALPELERNYTK